MKRSINLQPLSKHHHDELLGCLIIKKGVQKNADIIILKDFTNKFWNDHLKNHLDLEENVLIPFLVKHGFENRYIKMLRTDHLIINVVLERLNKFDSRPKVCAIFANLVEQHIRFQERFIFGIMQESISETQLEELRLQLNGIHQSRCIDYPVKFWE